MMKSYAFDFEHPNGLSAFTPSSLLGCFGVGVDCNRTHEFNIHSEHNEHNFDQDFNGNHGTGTGTGAGNGTGIGTGHGHGHGHGNGTGTGTGTGNNTQPLSCTDCLGHYLGNDSNANSAAHLLEVHLNLNVLDLEHLCTFLSTASVTQLIAVVVYLVDTLHLDLNTTVLPLLLCLQAHGLVNLNTIISTLQTSGLTGLLGLINLNL
jgi:hypothetical protein